MDNIKCQALVPYFPKLRRFSKLTEAFKKRRTVYFLFLPLVLSFAFAGAYYCIVYASRGSFIRLSDFFIDFFLFSPNTVAVALFVLAAAFTVFSPAGGIVIIPPLAFGCGCAVADAYAVFGIGRVFWSVAFCEAFYLFSLLLFSTELCMRLVVTRMGFKFVVAGRNTIPFLVKSLLFSSVFYLNTLFLEYNGILKGF